LFLWPLLAPGAVKMSGRARVLGICLLAGPIVLSLSPLYVLDPPSIRENVLHYRSFGSGFGLMGLLRTLDVDAAGGAYGRVFPMAFLAGLVPLAIFLARRPMGEDRGVVLLAALILLFPFTFGTGYGPQYWIWVLAPWLVCCREYKGAFGKLLVGVGIVIVVSDVVDYAVVPWLGDLAYCMTGSAKLRAFAQGLYNGDRTLAMMHLPMTVATLGVFFAGVLVLSRRGRVS
jgi:hypothetical protein